jgi:hypothetical protein
MKNKIPLLSPILPIVQMAIIATWISILAFSLLPNATLARSAEIDENGIRVHRLKSPYQEKETSLRVLLSDELKEGKRYRVLFVLPVHEDGLFEHGDGLVEAQKSNIHNMHQLICVAPAFSSKPWYADHDQNPAKLDESHLLKTVIPYLMVHEEIPHRYFMEAYREHRWDSGWMSEALEFLIGD